MYRIYSTLIEIVAAAVFIIPIWCIYNKLLFRSWKITILYIIFWLLSEHNGTDCNNKRLIEQNRQYKKKQAL